MAEGLLSKDKTDLAVQLSLLFVVVFEWLGTRLPLLGHIYERVFYREMIVAECRAAGLKPGARVLHIGSGRLPMTAMALAAMGMEVVGVDNDRDAVRISQNVLKQCSARKRISIQHADGIHWDCSQYDAVWISFHVLPKHLIVHQVLQSLGSNGCVIYRNPRGWLKHLYPSVVLSGKNQDCCQQGCLRQTLGKESVILRKGDIACKH